MNQERTEVAKNARLELGLDLPDSILQLIQYYMAGNPNQRKGLNPFVSWDIDVQAHFEHTSSKAQFSAIGFWFTDIRRNQKANKWDQLKTDHQFRIRYAPDQLGGWSVYLTAAIKGVPLYISDTLDFTVIDSKQMGFVTLNDSTQYLEREGRMIMPTGVNLPFPSNKNNLFYSLDKKETLDLAAWEEYANLVKEYVRNGGEYFRFFMHPSATEIEFEEVGFYQDRQNQAWEMDQLLSFCEENNTLIQFNLMYHTYFMKLGDYNQFRYDFTDNWHDPKAWPYKDPNVPSGYSVFLKSNTPSDMFLKEEAMRYLKQRTRYVMARWGYSNSLSAIELLCEPWHIDEHTHNNEAPYDDLTAAGDTARKAVFEYHKQIASYIKDSIQYTQHLLAGVGRFPVGRSAIYSHFTSETPGFIDSTWYLDDLDFISISYYSRSPEKLIHSKSSANNVYGSEENSMAATIQRLKRTYDKPVLFGESDHGDASHECSDYQGHKIDLMRYPFTGAIGHFIWAGFTRSDNFDNNIRVRDETDAWPYAINAKDYFNSDDFIEVALDKSALGREKSKFKSSEKEIVEHQYIIGRKEDVAVGYVYNRTFNIRTAGSRRGVDISDTPCMKINEDLSTPIEISWRPNRLKVEGLKSLSNYRVLFYDYSGKSLLTEAKIRSSLFGKLKLTHPLLVPEKSKTPLLWYRIEKLN
ncbi:hypothetical protein [Brumimicrobium oceani]|nr:hypothetical protein [Brumimicrobium oceani]